MDVIIRHNHINDHPRPWLWEASPQAKPTAPSVPRSRAGFPSCEEAEADALREGHAVVGGGSEETTYTME